MALRYYDADTYVAEGAVNVFRRSDDGVMSMVKRGEEAADVEFGRACLVETSLSF